MTNLEKYIEAFTASFELDASQLEGLEYQGTAQWDSVGHMSLISALEDAFDIMIEVDDILALNSFEKGKEIIAKYGVELN